MPSGTLGPFKYSQAAFPSEVSLDAAASSGCGLLSLAKAPLCQVFPGFFSIDKIVSLGLGTENLIEAAASPRQFY